ncbi:MAG: DNA-protecting protein DprA [Robiginitomaculum sp.]|nr:DNA-protecting protein DprA [Robiginitomaculum sp.]
MSDNNKPDHSKLRDWLRLTRTSGVGPVTFRDLILRYGTATDALDAIPELAKRGGRIKPLSIPTIEQAEAEIDELNNIGGQMLASYNPDYPKLLNAIDPPPPIISVLGDVSCLNPNSCSIVGSRNASAIGMRFARQLAGELGNAGMIVVSGLARGIDGAAHIGAINTGTIAVVAGGIDHVYPSEHADLRQKIIETGAIISERRLGYKAIARDFPRRNRIISGLSLGTIVIEAALRSGSLITARTALEQNREVFSCPGSPLDPRSRGSNDLIKQGAHLIESADDVLHVLQSQSATRISEGEPEYGERATSNADEEQIDLAREKILELLSPSPIHRDEIVRASSYSVAACSAALIELELAGLAQCLPGGLVYRTS